MLKYINHLIECQCILPIYKKRTKPVYHKFKVFSEIDENGIVIKKYVSCNNCDSIHEVNEIFKSEVMWGKENYLSLVTSKNDIKFNLKSENLDNIVDILEKNDCDISIWENVYFIFQNEIEEDFVVVDKEEIGNVISVKMLKYKNNKFKITNETYQKDINIS